MSQRMRKMKMTVNPTMTPKKSMEVKRERKMRKMSSQA